MTDHDYESTGEEFDQKFDEVDGRLREADERIAALESGSGGGGGEYSGDGLLNLEGLAAALEPYLDTGDEVPDDVQESLTRLDGAVADAQASLDALADEVAALEESAGKSDEEIRQLIREFVDEHVDDGGGGGGGSTNLDAELEAIRRERKRFSLVGSPNHSRVIAKGPHQDDDYHSHGGWGLVATPQEDVVWRSAKINAEEPGSTMLELFEMDYETDETYEVGDRIETHEVNVTRSGESTIHPDIVLPAGQTVFISRDSAVDPYGALPLKRAEEEVNWSDLNNSHDVPLTIHCTWQRGRGQPGTQAFQDYRDANWHRTLHYYRDLEFGFNEGV